MDKPQKPSISIAMIEDHEIETVAQLIKSAVSDFDQSTQVVSSIMRRIENFSKHYHVDGAVFLVARDGTNDNKPVAGAGLGSLHGLPTSEGIGELRDLVVDPSYRGHGIGANLINTCIEKAKEIGYNKLYLETTPQMQVAQKLFLRTGFRPIRETSGQSHESDIASYFILEDLQD